MIETKIIDWLKNYISDSGLKTFVVGISGGIDSALVSTLLANTGYPTVVISMPIKQNSDQLKRAKNHINWLKDNFKNITAYEYDLTNVFQNFCKTIDNNDELACANTRSRLRMVCLYHIASINNGLVVGTGNKVEDFGVGFFTKYGDGGVDISPIADLTKTEVRFLAKKLGVNEDIIKAKPTDGLWEEDRSDEDQLGATYEELEWAMEYQEVDSEDNISSRQKEVLSIYKKFNSQNKHKILPIPIFKK